MLRSAFKTATTVALLTVVAPLSAATLPQIALIIDDLGDQSASGKRVIDLPGPVACAILPGSPHSSRLANLAFSKGKEILLHLPMQPSARATAHPASVTVDDSRSELLAALRAGLDSVPFATGVNNHQGSVMTQHPGHMAWLMEGIRENGDLFFVDSFTSARSVAFDIAREARIPTAKRDVFLDSDRSPEAIRFQFRRLIRIAKSRGSALGIGHPYPETLALLEAELPKLADYGVELVKVDELISRERTKLLLVESKPSDSGRIEVAEATTAKPPVRTVVAAADNAEVLDLRSRVNDLGSQLDKAKRQNEELSRVIREQQSVSAELADARKTIAALRESELALPALRQQLDQTAVSKSTVESKLQRATEQLALAEKQRDEANARVSQLQQERQLTARSAASLTQERDQALANASRLQSEIRSTRQLQSQTGGSLVQLREELLRERDDRKALEIELAKLTEQTASNQASISATANERDAAIAELSKLRTGIERGRARQTEATSTISRLRQELAAERQERQKTEAQLGAELASIKLSAREAADAVIRERSLAKAERAALIAERDNALSASRSVETQRITDSMKLESMTVNLQQRIAALEEKNRQLEIDGAQQLSRLDEQAAALKRANADRLQLQANLDSERQRRVASELKIAELQKARDATAIATANAAARSVASNEAEQTIKVNALRSVIRDAVQERRMLETEISDVEARLRVRDRPRLQARLRELQGDLITTNAKIRAFEKVRDMARQEIERQSDSLVAAQTPASRLRLDTELNARPNAKPTR